MLSSLCRRFIAYLRSFKVNYVEKFCRNLTNFGTYDAKTTWSKTFRRTNNNEKGIPWSQPLSWNIYLVQILFEANLPLRCFIDLRLELIASLHDHCNNHTLPVEAKLQFKIQHIVWSENNESGYKSRSSYVYEHMMFQS